MRLASALSERAILQEKITDLRSRMAINAVVQEGETSPEDVWELLQVLDSIIEKYEHILAAINLTNSRRGDPDRIAFTA